MLDLRLETTKRTRFESNEDIRYLTGRSAQDSRTVGQSSLGEYAVSRCGDEGF